MIFSFLKYLFSSKAKPAKKGPLNIVPVTNKLGKKGVFRDRKVLLFEVTEAFRKNKRQASATKKPLRTLKVRTAPHAQQFPASTIIWVGNLLPGVTEADLKELFGTYGNIVEVKTHSSAVQGAAVRKATPEIMSNPEGKTFFASVRFSEPREAHDAIEHGDEIEIEGDSLIVTFNPSDLPETKRACIRNAQKTQILTPIQRHTSNGLRRKGLKVKVGQRPKKEEPVKVQAPRRSARINQRHG
ncbi:hypothetical protein D9611_007732 [Ephemerocybe angulata]|uniref:RRM domain-containing protein n=1 Tax=Ephemerocybe angulata TaxID=980116 RepID=A0A8H5BYG4_9AGAR|nr:hypothetical protein D9611_007732 [Tulosesus angulatus]